MRYCTTAFEIGMRFLRKNMRKSVRTPLIGSTGIIASRNKIADWMKNKHLAHIDQSAAVFIQSSDNRLHRVDKTFRAPVGISHCPIRVSIYGFREFPRRGPRPLPDQFDGTTF